MMLDVLAWPDALRESATFIDVGSGTGHEAASAMVLPLKPLVVHLAHPFTEDVADLLVTELIGSCLALPRPIAIGYGLPTLHRNLAPRVFEAGGVFRGTRAQRWAMWTNFAWLGMPYAQAA